MDVAAGPGLLDLPPSSVLNVLLLGQLYEVLPMHKMLFAGGMAGFVQWLFCYPLDVVKSNMQADSIHRVPQQLFALFICLV